MKKNPTRGATKTPLHIMLRRRREQLGLLQLSPQNDNVLFAQSRNVLLTPPRLGRCKKDNY